MRGMHDQLLYKLYFKNQRKPILKIIKKTNEPKRSAITRGPISMYSNQQNPTPMRIAARYALFSTASAKDLTVTISIKFFTNFELVIA